MSSNIFDLIGIPFVDSGRNPKTGLDCWGLVICASEILSDVKMPDFDIGAFCKKVISSKFKEERDSGKWVKLGGPEKGCLVVLRINPGFDHHFGVCIDEKTFIHTMEKTMSIIEKFDHPYWKRKIHGYYRYVV